VEFGSLLDFCGFFPHGRILQFSSSPSHGQISPSLWVSPFQSISLTASQCLGRVVGWRAAIVRGNRKERERVAFVEWGEDGEDEKEKKREEKRRELLSTERDETKRKREGEWDMCQCVSDWEKIVLSSLS
jgi:hypothetical protein